MDDKKKDQSPEIYAQPEDGSMIKKSRDLFYNKWSSLIGYSAALLMLVYIASCIPSPMIRGLFAMGGTLVMRIFMDFLMIKQRRFSIGEAVKTSKQQLISYYETRKYMHIIITPLLLAAYTYGFSMLLSIFKSEQMGEFYFYIFYLAWGIFFGLALLMVLQLRKELEILKSLIVDNAAY